MSNAKRAGRRPKDADKDVAAKGAAKNATKTKRASKKAPDQDPALASSLSFEGALEKLEQTVVQLESGEMPLEEALELFESGVQLSRQCNETLETAERRIEILIADRANRDPSDADAEASESFDFEDDSEDFED